MSERRRHPCVVSTRECAFPIHGLVSSSSFPRISLTYCRINIKYGGYDVTKLLLRLSLQNSFPYSKINLWCRYDFLIAEELKCKYTTLHDGDVSMQTHDFYLRRPEKATQKYTFRVYDEVYLAPMSHFKPALTDHSHKLEGRRSLWERSYDIYDNMPNDQMSGAQQALYQSLSSKLTEVADGAPEAPPPRLFGAHLNPADLTPRSSVAGSPVPETSTPVPGAATPSGQGGVQGGEMTANGSVAGGAPVTSGGLTPHQIAMREWDEYDSTVPTMPLDRAVIDSITHAAKGDEKKMRDFFAGIMVVGGAGAVPGFRDTLEDRIRGGLAGRDVSILIGVPPRELDMQVIAWKGASVFGKLRHTNDSWVKQREYDMLGNRVLTLKCMWNF